MPGRRNSIANALSCTNLSLFPVLLFLNTEMAQVIDLFIEDRKTFILHDQ